MTKIVLDAEGVVFKHIEDMKKFYGQKSYTSTLKFITMEHKRLLEQNKGY